MRTWNAAFQENAMFFYIAMCLHILSCYVKLTRVLVKRRQLEKTAVVKAEAYIMSTDWKLVNCVFFFGNTYHDVYSNNVPVFR